MVPVLSVSRIASIACLLALVGCATPPPPQATATADTPADATLVAEGDTDYPETEVAAAEGSGGMASRPVPNTRPIPSTAFAVSSAYAAQEYVIAPQDVIDVTVFQVPDLSKTVPVSARGSISLPLIGEVAAAGRTPAQLEADITARLAADYLQSPDVSVFVADPVSQRVTIEGAVNKPGIYPTSGQTTLLQVVALAGGLDRIADTRGIVVFRQVAGQRHAAKFDFRAIRAGTAEDPVVMGGDVVVVDESGAKAAFRNVRETIGLFGLFVPFI